MPGFITTVLLMLLSLNWLPGRALSVPIVAILMFT